MQALVRTLIFWSLLLPPAATAAPKANEKRCQKLQTIVNPTAHGEWTSTAIWMVVAP